MGWIFLAGRLGVHSVSGIAAIFGGSLLNALDSEGGLGPKCNPPLSSYLIHDGRRGQNYNAPEMFGCQEVHWKRHEHEQDHQQPAEVGWLTG